jgi:lipopolysaccharide biosynthesis glycosyltransferase
VSVKSRYAVYIGYDPREDAAFAVARESCKYYSNMPIPVYGLLLQDLIEADLYKRPIEFKPSAADKPVMWDVVSDAPMSTEHANARFFVPMIAKEGWALFVDGDVMFRSDISKLFRKFDESKAVYCVHHEHKPKNKTKMDGQVQTKYKRKNWSSVIAFNCDHPANKALTLDVLNNTPGRDLHALFWLADCDIGELDASWNYLVGHSDPEIEPDIVHFTDGIPTMAGYGNVPYAGEWFDWRNRWARGYHELAFQLSTPKWEDMNV